MEHDSALNYADRSLRTRCSVKQTQKDAQGAIPLIRERAEQADPHRQTVGSRLSGAQEGMVRGVCNRDSFKFR